MKADEEEEIKEDTDDDEETNDYDEVARERVKIFAFDI